jgi:ADP-ribose pyrophosphatase
MGTVRTLRRNLVAENTKFDIYFDHVIDSVGHEVPNYLVVAPKQKTENLITGVGILPIVEEKIGLIQIFRPALRDYSWEIPHGFIEPSESDQAAAVRELMEETGLHVGHLTSLGLMTPDSGVLAGRVHLYLAEDCTQTNLNEGELGIKQLKFFPITEFQDMVLTSKIQDSFTLSAWCRYFLLRELHA